MKKIILLILIILPITVKAYTPSASSYTVMDMDTKRVLQSGNQHEERLIASITKIMTALITLNNIDIEKNIKVSPKVL